MHEIPDNTNVAESWENLQEVLIFFLLIFCFSTTDNSTTEF